MGLLSSIFGGSNKDNTPATPAAPAANADGTYPVVLNTTFGFGERFNVAPGKTAAQLLQDRGLTASSLVIKREYKDETGATKKAAITADYQLQPGDVISAITPKNVSGA